MVSNQKTALILGASGLTGGFCLKYLLDSNYYSSVIALVRTDLNIKHPKLKQVIVDFNNTAAMEQYYVDVDDVFCCLGSTIKKAGSQSAFRRVDFHIPTEAANIASSHGVKQFLVISSAGAYNKSSNFYLRVKGEMEAGISQFTFRAIHIFRPSLLMGTRRENRPAEAFTKVISKLLSPVIGVFSSKLIISIEASDLATAMVNVAQLGKEGKNIYSSAQIEKYIDKKTSASQAVMSDIE